MSGFFAQLKREVGALFVSPIAYVLLTVAMIVNGLSFVWIVDVLASPYGHMRSPMQAVFGGNVIFFILLIALAAFLTMRSVSEEKRQGTIETLLTAPISETAVILAKYFATVLAYVVIWIPTGLYVAFFSRFASLDYGPIWGGYLGTFALGSMFLAIGVLCSTVTRNQIIAALLTFAICTGIFLAAFFHYFSGLDSSESILAYFNLLIHMEHFGLGIIDTRPLVLYCSVSVFTLFCSVQVLQSRRWRG